MRLSNESITVKIRCFFEFDLIETPENSGSITIS